MINAVLKLVVPLLLSCSVLAWSDPQESPPDASPFPTAEGLVASLYDAVTFEAGTTPDWDHVRSMFIDEAVIVLRTSRQSTTVFSVEGFVEDFVKFIERADARRTGFTERIIRTRPMVFGDMAHVLVLYEASIPGSPRPPQQGVDSFSLIRKQDRWWIAAVTNEIPTPDRPVPEQLR
ncbi:MAG: hypothetical protein ACYTGC_12490 [Planctomycetota bacterium]|jgi:hypothetical protein